MNKHTRFCSKADDINWFIEQDIVVMKIQNPSFFFVFLKDSRSVFHKEVNELSIFWLILGVILICITIINSLPETYYIFFLLYLSMLQQNLILCISL